MSPTGDQPCRRLEAIRRLGLAVVAAVAIGAAASGPAGAHDNNGGSHDGGSHGGGGHGGSWHGGGGWHEGHWDNHWRGGGIGSGAWLPDYGLYDNPAYPYADPDAPSYAAPGPVANVWYFCRDPAGYYPYVQQCAGGWLQVPAQPSG